MLKTLIQVDPKKRPSCEDILKMSIVQQRVTELGLDNYEEHNELSGNELLGTIKVPNNLKVLR